MYRPSTKFNYIDADDSDGKLIPELSPEAKISDHDVGEISFFARKVINGSLDYLIINVYGSGANLPVSGLSILNVAGSLFDS
jgi:hypothetical protein